MKLSTRRRNIISGLCALVLVVGAGTVGIKWAFGFFDDGYEIVADFAAAGQGLVEDSDVKIRGLDVGHVESIELVDGRARVTMFIDGDRGIPARTSSFTIRPKTLFGEKFVDVVPGPDEGDGPFFEDGDVVPRFFDEGAPMPDEVLRNDEGQALRSAGGFELEEVLNDVYPILEAIDPGDVRVVLDEFAIAGDGLGETINRSIVNGERVTDVQVARDAEMREFLDDLASLTGELADRAPDLVTGAANLNEALPVLTEDPAALTALLQSLERTSSEVADLLEANADFIEIAYTDGQRVLDLLYGRRTQVVPLLTGMRTYMEVLSSVARIPVGDGTVMAAVKGIMGGELCNVIPCAGGVPASAPPAPAPTPLPVPLPPLPTIPLPQLPGLPSGPIDLNGLIGAIDGEVSRGGDAVRDLLTGIVRPGAG